MTNEKTDVKILKRMGLSDYLIDIILSLKSGIPAGGTTDQVLSKTDNTDYNTEWKTITAEAELPYKLYVARLNQTLTGNVVATVRQNNLEGGPGSWQRESAGVYNFTIVDGFGSSGEVFIGTPRQATMQIFALNNGTDGFKVFTFNNGIPADSVLEDCAIEIRRYPD